VVGRWDSRLSAVHHDPVHPGADDAPQGHGWLFVFGIFFPIFWLIGAVMQPAAPRAA
jgi:hypothetical protein